MVSETASVVAMVVSVVSMLGIATVLVIYPAGVFLLSKLVARPVCRDASYRPSVSILIAAHRAAEIIQAKIENSLGLRFPSDSWEVVVFCDGIHADDTRQKVKPHLGERVRFFFSEEHAGKINALNCAAHLCKGDVIVFSDVDALLDEAAIEHLVKHLADPAVGGVCGRTTIREKAKDLSSAQSTYLGLERRIRIGESRLGSVATNTGKIYAVRKKLLRNIPEGVADDLFNCLSVARQGFRFLFEPAAVANISLPSRSAKHELERRRRLVLLSFNAIIANREVLNPFRHGILAVGLVVTKIMRRLMPLMLIALYACSMVLAVHFPAALVFAVLQTAFYAAACLYVPFVRFMPASILRKLLTAAHYFCVGNLGMLLGLLDFARGRTHTKWRPLKSDA